VSAEDGGQGPAGTRASPSADRRERIEATLQAALAPAHLEVVDESHLHAGHAGARSGGGHFRVLVVSERFAGKSQLERQRLVYGALRDEMGDAIHALAMKTLTAAEWQR
jgi:BolA protein